MVIGKVFSWTHTVEEIFMAKPLLDDLWEIIKPILPE